jgi:predicted Zn-dependent protease
MLALLIASAQQLSAQEGLPKALELYRGGNYRAAEAIFKEILKKEPRNITIHKMLADCLMQDNRLEEAKQEYRQILRLSPGDADAKRVLTPEPAVQAAPKPSAPKGSSAGSSGGSQALGTEG